MSLFATTEEEGEEERKRGRETGRQRERERETTDVTKFYRSTLCTAITRQKVKVVVVVVIFMNSVE